MLVADRPLLGFTGAYAELHHDSNFSTVNIVDPCGVFVLHPRTRSEALEMYKHPFCYGYNYSAVPTEDDGA